MSTPRAVGYLRRDISGEHQPWHETGIRSVASRTGYTLCKTVALSGTADDPIAQLIDTVRRSRAEAVIVPTLEHVGGEVPERLLREVTEVIPVDNPHQSIARWPLAALLAPPDRDRRPDPHTTNAKPRQ
ncbi:hypothetical protein FEK35_30970 [Nocardia cyriacigeorgica]|uniref:Recombinase family protein n=1 Tax=Nocardia cyriacigeorgica TaxID=135487 RepID=A0A5R8P4Y2_9NOCA|nr:hypothetical protein [Nocardia cyriacigeorgica]TLF92254.1 hypothetical protein FEK35_30970 [Nocardia cyriacigeorgica]